ncbi:hypothetical protein C4578_04285 [Candidatus Microgenomates bacterium]|jgi:thioredoxin reductase (NADPH)|nr:MAG: hypothetical protein C4578_04285 [Candidatus Microgenomates bacterium]
MVYDTVIIGSGLAGLTASIYASRYQMTNIVIGKVLGGTITLAHQVENFPGFPSISGIELSQKIAEQVKGLGAEIVAEKVVEVEIMAFTDGKKHFKVITETGKQYEARTLIVTTGTERRKLGVAGEREYLGKGVSYCTNCDAPFFKNKKVAVVGGGDAAVSGAVHLAGFASKVFLIHRRDEFRAEPIWVEDALSNQKIEVLFNTQVLEIIGDGNKVTAIKIDKEVDGSKIPIDGIFVEIGGIPESGLLSSLGVSLDENNFVVTSERMETSVPGLFAAGDFTTQGLIMSQAITACAQGAIAAASAFKYIKNKNAPRI